MAPINSVHFYGLPRSPTKSPSKYAGRISSSQYPLAQLPARSDPDGWSTISDSDDDIFDSKPTNPTSSTSKFKPNSSSSEVHSMPELLQLISEYCDWSSLRAMGFADRALRIAERRVVCGRINFFVAKFVGSDNVRTFFNLLEQVSGMVVGGIVRCMMSISETAYSSVFPRMMDIVMPFQEGKGMGSFNRFLIGINFNRGERITRDFSPDGLRCVRYQHKFTHLFIYIIDVSSDPLRLVLSAPHTSLMNVLTPTRLYCFYPELLARGENISTSTSHQCEADLPLHPFNFGLRTYRDTNFWEVMDRSCGLHCSAVWRSTLGLPGVSVIRWGGISGIYDTGAPHPALVSASDGFENMRYTWRIGLKCTNSRCPFYSRGCLLTQAT